MPVLHLDNVPSEVYDRLRQLAVRHNHSVEAEAVGLLQRGVLAETSARSQAELLAELRQRSFTPPPPHAEQRRTAAGGPGAMITKPIISLPEAAASVWPIRGWALR
jgi:plasmid stability protein